MNMYRGGSTFDACMRQIWWRFWWADSYFNRPGLYFWAGRGRGNVRLWGRDVLLQVLIVALTVPGLWLAGGNGVEAKWGFLVLLAALLFALLPSEIDLIKRRRVSRAWDASSVMGG